jgi:MerR family mercuric resistance operon transcriptional regulator
MRIGELSRRAGVNLQTLRFYERKGLLREPRRTPAGYRDYSAVDLEEVRFIRECQHLGFTLREIEQLAQLHRAFARVSPHDLVQSDDLRTLVVLAQRKLLAIEAKIDSLRIMHQQLAAAVTGLEHRSTPVCPAAKVAPKNA